MREVSEVREVREVREVKDKAFLRLTLLCEIPKEYIIGCAEKWFNSVFRRCWPL